MPDYKFEKGSYYAHAVHENEMAKRSELPSLISAPDSIDRLRHQRMFDSLVGKLAKAFPNSTWLTIGDGRFGSDAIYLKNYGLQVHASSLTDASLKVSKEKGWINEYSTQNAEDLSFADDSFDFVLCKESYHHFPRPPIAFYEMLRVARIGTVLVEPYRAKYSPLGFVKTIFKKLTGRTISNEYETCGNYIYRLSLEAIYHMARALNLPSMAWSFHNDFYHPRFFKSTERNSKELLIFKWGILTQDLLSKTKLLAPGGVSCTVFKKELDNKERSTLKSARVRIVDLTRNPYLNR
jgi:ubiquinone/menaquinone biosynthesis C-methylase UbiE